LEVLSDLTKMNVSSVRTA